MKRKWIKYLVIGYLLVSAYYYFKVAEGTPILQRIWMGLKWPTYILG